MGHASGCEADGFLADVSARSAKIHRPTILPLSLADQRLAQRGSRWDSKRWLARLREDLASKTCQPEPVLGVTIPKPGNDFRLLGIPTIRSRVAQMAAKLVLADFKDNAFDFGAVAMSLARSRPCTGDLPGSTPSRR